MKISVFLSILTVYILSSSFTHFQFIPSSFYAENRRISYIINIRELSIIVLFLYATIKVWTSRVDFNKYVYSIFLFFSLFLIMRSYIDSGKTTDILVGLRITILMMVTILLPFCFSGTERYLKYTFYMVAFVLVIQMFIAPFQIVGMPKYYGETFLGSRPVGTFASPLHLSLFCGSAATLFVALKFRYWKILLFIAFMISVASGGRAGIIVSSLAVMWVFEPRIRKNYGNIAAFIFVIPFIVFFVYLAASTTFISGRDDTETGVGGEARWVTWALVIARGFYNADLNDWLFGLGVGVGSNTAASVATGTRNISDSMFVFLLQSYGLVGIAVFLFVAAYFWRSAAKLSYLAMTAWFISANTQVIIELHPANLILLSGLAVGARSRRKALPEAERLYLPGGNPRLARENGERGTRGVPTFPGRGILDEPRALGDP